MIDVSVIIVSYKSVSQIEDNLKSIYSKITGVKYEIIIVNNYSGDTEMERLKQYPDLRIIENNSNYGFGKANNIGAAVAKGKYILFLNPDVILLQDIDKLISMLDTDSKIGVIGPLIKTVNNSIQTSCGEFPNPKNWFVYNLLLNRVLPKIKLWGNYPMSYFRYCGNEEVDWITGAFMLCRLDVFKKIGGFDENIFMFNEDVDICWRLKKTGYKTVFSDQCSIIHLEGHSASKFSKNRAKMIYESYNILWSKYYDSNTVNKFNEYFYIGIKLRLFLWSVKRVFSDDNFNNQIEYYKVFEGLIRERASKQRCIKVEKSDNSVSVKKV